MIRSEDNRRYIITLKHDAEIHVLLKIVWDKCHKRTLSCSVNINIYSEYSTCDIYYFSETCSCTDIS